MKRLAIYAHFGESPKVARYVWYFLKELRSLGFEICFVSNSPISIESQSEISTLSQKFIQREIPATIFPCGRRAYRDTMSMRNLIIRRSSAPVPSKTAPPRIII